MRNAKRLDSIPYPPLLSGVEGKFIGHLILKSLNQYRFKVKTLSRFEVHEYHVLLEICGTGGDADGRKGWKGLAATLAFSF